MIAIVPIVLAICALAFVVIENVQASRAAIKLRRREELRLWNPTQNDALRTSIKPFAVLTRNSAFYRLFRGGRLPVTTWTPRHIAEGTTGFEVDQHRLEIHQWNAVTAIVAFRSKVETEDFRAEVLAGAPILIPADEFQAEALV